MNRVLGRNTIRLLMALGLVLAVLPSGIGPVEAVACSPGFSVAPVHGPVYYLDVSDGLTGRYVGYQITNNTGSDIDDLWVTLDNFAGSVVSLAPNEDGELHVGLLGAGATTTAYFYLDASGTSGSAQTHDINVWPTRPDVAGLPLCTESDTFTSADDTIGANANKVTGSVAGPDPAEIGGIVTLTVTGETGQIGAAGIFAATPAAFPDWPADAFQLVSSQIEIMGVGTFTDDLFLSGLSGSRDYTLTYMFIATGSTVGPTAISPMQSISSGTQIKHTSLSSITSLPPISPPVNNTTLAKSASPDTLPPTGGTVDYSVDVTNDGTITVTLDEFTDTLPSGVGYIPGSATFAGSPIGDPIVSGSQLIFIGSYAVAAGTTSSLGYQVALPATVGTYLNSVVALIGPTQIDTSLDTSDDMPASATVTVQTPGADLVVAKSVDDPNPNEGDTVNFTVLVTNNGPDDATNIQINDQIPLGLTLVSATASQGSYAAPVWTVGDVPAAGAATLTLEATVATGTAGTTTTNTATVTAVDQSDPSPGDESDSAAITVQGSDLSVTKTASPDPVLVGQALTYMITATNNGPDAATNAIVTDPLPPDVTFGSATPSQGGCAETGGLVTCSLGTINNGGSATITVVVQPDPAAGNMTLSNTVSIAADQGDPSPGDESATATTEVDPLIDVAVTKADSPDPVAVGGALVYTVVATNNGPSSATSVVVTDTMPSGVTFVSATSTLGSCSEAAGTVTCAVGTLTAGSGATVTINVIPGAGTGGTVTNTATVSAAEMDADPANNSATASTSVEEAADLTVAKSASPDPVFVGQDLVYTITASNAGPVDASGVVVTDALPAGVAFVSAVPTQGSCSEAAGVVTCPLGTLADGASADIAVTVQPTTAVENTTITNTVDISGDQVDPNPANNSSSVDADVDPSADLAIIKVAAPDPTAAGGTLTYTLTVSNAGPSASTASVSTDVLPSGVTFNAGLSDPGCAESGGVVTCGGGLVGAGASIDIVVAVDLAPDLDAGTVLPNTATVVGSEPDPDPGNNTTSITSGVIEDVTLAVVKTFSADPVTAGTSGSSFAIEVTNTGLSDADNLVVNDAVPPELSVTGVTADGGGDCSASAGQSVSCAYAHLAPGATATITVTFDVDTTVDAQTVSNTATATSDEDTANGTTSVGIAEDVILGVTKSFNLSPVAAGTSGQTFMVLVSNAGVSDADNVVVSDTVDAAIAVTSVTADAGGVCTSGNSFSCTFGALAAGATATITVTYDVPPATPAGLIANTASAVSDEITVPVNGSDTVEVVSNVILSITKAFDQDPVTAGAGPYSFTLVATNSGTSDATNVVVTDTVPAQLTVTGVSPSPDCGNAGNIVTCTFPVLGPGASQVITVSFDTPETSDAQVVSNTASVLSNEVVTPATGTDMVEIVEDVDLAVVKTFADASVAAGTGPYTLTIGVTNSGSSDADNVVVTDLLAAALAVGTVTPPAGGDCSATSGNAISCTVPTLASGATATVTVTYTVPENSEAQTVANTASATSDEDTASGSDSVEVVEDVDLTVIKTFLQSPVVAGVAGYSFTIAVTNSGSSDADNLVVTDTVDPGLAVVNAAAGSGGICTVVANTITCTFATLAAGATAVVTANFDVPLTTDTGSITNTASAASDEDSALGSDTVPVVEDAPLAVTKAFADSSVVAGTPGPYSFAITVTNTGSSDADNVEVLDSVPVGLTVLSVTPDAGTCLVAGNDIDCDIVALTPGATATIVVMYSVPAGTDTSTLSNTAGATSDENAVPTTATDTVDVTEDVVLAVAKVFSPTAVVAGTGGHTFTITISNSGTSDADSVEILDSVPPELSVTAATADSGGTCVVVGTDIDCDFAALASGSTATITVTYDVPASTDTQTVLNTATATSDEVATPVPSTASVDISKEADLSITKDSGPDPFVPGNAITYTITVSNSGPSQVTAVRLVDDLPSTVLTPLYTPDQGSYDAVTGDWTGLALDPGDSATLTIDGTVDPGYVGVFLTNTASVSAIDGSTDPDPSDNAATEQNPSDPQVDLEITKDNGLTAVVPGTTVTYSIVVTNNGPSAIFDAGVADALPSALLSATWTCIAVGGACADIAGAGDIATTVSLFPSGTATFTLSAVVDDAASGTLDNTASVTQPAIYTETNPTNNSATDSDPLTPEADLAISKSDLPDPATEGNALIYSLTIDNLGPSTAVNVTVADVLPAGVTYISATPSIGACTEAGGTVTCILGDLAPGAANTVAVEVVVDPGTVGPIDNVASVTSDTVDPDSANNSVTETTTVDAAATISGAVLFDVGADGNGSGDPGLGGVTVNILDSLSSVVGTAVTTPDGSYSFSLLPPGDYTVEVDTGTLPAGMTETFDADGGNDSTTAVSVAAGDVAANTDFGYTGTGSLDGTVFEDIANDGIFDAADPGLGGVDVALIWAGPDGVFGTADDVSYAATTGADGSYGFGNLPAGDYRTDVDQADVPPGLTLTTGNDPNDVTLVPAGTATVDFGFGTNAPPVGIDDSATTPEDTPVTINVLSNDADPNGDPIAVESITQPTNGTAVLNADGTITYTPNPDFSGTDTFTYLVCETSNSDGSTLLCDTVTVTVTVSPVNDPPQLVGDDVFTITQGDVGPPLIYTDPEGDERTFTVLGGTLPPGLTLDSDGVWSGTATTPGTYVFTLEVCDDAVPVACTTDVLTIVVTQIPVTGSDSALILALGGALLGFGLMALLIASAMRRRRLE